jgi:hypothetical protein
VNKGGRGMRGYGDYCIFILSLGAWEWGWFDFREDRSEESNVCSEGCEEGRLGVENGDGVGRGGG